MLDDTEREKIARERIQEIGSDTFPDDEVEWRVLGVRHSGEFSLVETEPAPASVGYPRFTFVLHFDSLGRVQECACYALADGRWILLATTPGAPQGWRSIPLK